MLLEMDARAERGYAPEDADARRNLVKRIVASSTFARSNRLTEFLKYVYSLAEKGRFEDIHEQNIGAAIFGRARDYDAAADSIVRSHASRLRHRLKEYFEVEGQNEPLVLTIPRGSYVPLFEPRPQAKSAENVQPVTAEIPDEFQVFPGIGIEEPVSLIEDGHHSGSANNADLRKKIVRLRVVVVSLLVLIVLLGVRLFIKHPAPDFSQREAVSQNLLWRELLASGPEKTLVVSSDSGLVMFQHLTGRSVSLASYVNGNYLKDTNSNQVPSQVVQKFGTRRYTPAIDLAVLERMIVVAGGRYDRLSFRYARDLRIEDLKKGNAVLLGSAESNPWVQLYEPSLNFHFVDDLLHDKARMVNLHPLAGESDHYDSTPEDSTPTVYGLVAYRANLQNPGHVLILEGQTMAGTQTSVDFVFDEAYLLPFLRKIVRPDGTIPEFEVLLRSRSFAGQSSRIEIVAYRVA